MPSLTFPILDPVAFSIGPLRHPLVCAGLCDRASRRLVLCQAPRRASRSVGPAAAAEAARHRRSRRLGGARRRSRAAASAMCCSIISPPTWRTRSKSSPSGAAACRSTADCWARRSPSCCLPARRQLNALTMLDLASTVAPLGLFFGRIANFINGEFWGRPAPDFPYAVVFPHAGPLPRHPSQLYEAFGEGLVLFVVMAVAVRLLRLPPPGPARRHLHSRLCDRAHRRANSSASRTSSSASCSAHRCKP